MGRSGQENALREPACRAFRGWLRGAGTAAAARQAGVAESARLLGHDNRRTRGAEYHAFDAFDDSRARRLIAKRDLELGKLARLVRDGTGVHLTCTCGVQMCHGESIAERVVELARGLPPGAGSSRRSSLRI